MTRFLSQIRIERYGALANREIGPFSPGLNVVYGPNEAGKSTVASFVGGVLFGWEEARGVLNTYRPEQGDRAGSLVFADAAGEGAHATAASFGNGPLDASGANASASDEPGNPPPQRAGEPGDPPSQRASAETAPSAPAASATVSRARNEEGLKGDRSLVADIDRATYQSVFSITSDELMRLRNTADVTARLLTAGSGTGTSPSGAFVEIEQRIAAHTSPAADAPRSVVRLAQQLEEKRLQVKAALDEVELRKQEDRELHELRMDRAGASARIDELNREVQDLAALRADLEAADEKIELRETELSGVRHELEAMREPSPAADVDARLLALDSAGERSLRDRIGELSEQREKAARIVDAAKENSATSTAAYEALIELDAEDGAAVSAGGRRRSRANHLLQAVVSVLSTLAFIAAGIPVFAYGRSINSLSFTALGVGLLVLAFLLASAAIVVMLRPGNVQDAAGDRKKDAQWVMLQDRKKLDSSLAEAQLVDERIAAFLEESGLAAANGSLRQARSLLDEAREARGKQAVDDQRTASLTLRERTLQSELEDLRARRRRIEEAAGLPEGASLRQADDLVQAKAAQRDALMEVADGMSLRYGELSRALGQARDDDALDALKLEYQQLRARLREANHELVELLLAKRMLERSIAAWESRNQPEVYAEASRLLSMITSGAWVQVSMSSAGSIVAKSREGVLRETRHLSLGTCQQLYLTLRIALLLTAEDVGRAIPVLADDILVNFDAARRLGAARALAELARRRQVIVFTCHEETVAALREADPTATHLALSPSLSS